MPGHSKRSRQCQVREFAGSAERYIVDVLFDRAGEHAITNRVRALNHVTGTYRELVLSMRTRALPPPIAAMASGFPVSIDWNDVMGTPHVLINNAVTGGAEA